MLNARRGTWRRTQPDVGLRPATSGVPDYVRCRISVPGPVFDASPFPIERRRRMSGILPIRGVTLVTLAT